jgi:hypothetical protein
MEKPNMAMRIGNLRPFNSDKGAQRVGPVANPITKSDTPRVEVTDPM